VLELIDLVIERGVYLAHEPDIEYLLPGAKPNDVVVAMNISLGG